VLHGLPKLNKFIEAIDKRLEELTALHVKGIDKPDAQTVSDFIVSHEKLE